MKQSSELDRRGFLKAAGVVAVSVAVPAGLWSCTTDEQKKPVVPGKGAAGGMAANEAAVAKLEAEEILTMEKPGKWKGKEAGHLPQVTFHEGEGAVTLFTKHSMSEAHWITAHYLRDQDGKLLGFQAYKGTDAEAKHRFDLPKGTTKITAYSHCNKHGDWQAADTKTA